MKQSLPALSVEDWTRLNRMLEHALELPPGERRRWLKGLPAESDHLRAVLVELLDDSERSSHTFADHRSPTVERIAAAAIDAMRREHTGDRVGPWRLERLIAEGGMGDVWLAERADGLMERRAALKLPRAEWADRGLAERIARERAILARLQHPHVAGLYDAGVTPEGRPYLALEFVEGVPIDLHCRDHAPNLRSVLPLFVKVARAVAYAHSRLVIHRDLKPSNVLVTADGTPKLLDFGISKLMQGDVDADDRSSLTRFAGRPFTLAYAAPEQILDQPVAISADIYGLGIVLYELCAGVRPHQATNPHDLAQEIVGRDVRKASEVAADPLRARQLRGDLDAILLKALKRAPEERHASAGEFADDLEKYLAGMPVNARPDGAWYRLRKFTRRNWPAMASAAGILAAIGIGSGLAAWQAQVARVQGAEAAALNSIVLSLIRQADPNASSQTRDVDVRLLTAIEQRINEEFKAAPRQMLGLRLTVADAYRNRGESAAAQRVYQRAADEARAHVPADDLQLLSAQINAADYRLIISSSAARGLDPVIDVLRHKGAEGADLLIDALLIRHQLRQFYGVPEFNEPAHFNDDVNEALEVVLRHFGRGSRQQLKVARRLAHMRALFDSPAEGRRVMESALGDASGGGPELARTAEYRDLFTYYSQNLCGTGRASEGVANLWSSVEAVRAAHGEHSSQMENLLAALDDCYAALQDPTGKWIADAAFSVAATRERPPSTQLLTHTERALAWAIGERDLDAAERYFRIAVQNIEAIADEPLRERLMRRVMMSRVCTLALRGETEEAERFAAPIVEALNAEFERLRRLTPLQDRLWSCLSFAQLHNGQAALAVATAQTLVDRCQVANLSPFVACTAGGLLARARAEIELGRHADVLKTLEERRSTTRTSVPLADELMLTGRALLGSGKAGEAIDPLRRAYGTWLASSSPRGVFAAEAEYWLARAYLEVGDPRGPWMLRESQRALAGSPLKGHQALSTTPSALPPG